MLKLDGTLRLMLEFNIPITRQNYLDLAFAGNPPEQPEDDLLEYLREIGVGNIVADNSTTEN